MRKTLIGGVVGLLSVTVGLLAVPGTAPAGLPTWSGTRTLVYCRDGGVPLEMTLFAPAPGATAPPVLLQVHGGGWKGGSRLVSLDQSVVARSLVARGLAVASVDYRLAPRYRWPAPIVDVACAVRFLRANAARLGVDGSRIGAWGPSSGGQLVAMLGTAATDRWDNGQYPDVSSRVQAVVDEFGVADLTDPELPSFTSELISVAFGSPPDRRSRVLDQASPVTHVGTGDPPFLIIQGTKDAVVPYEQSVELATKLRAAGDRVRLVLVRGGYHGLLNRGERPGPSTVDALLVRFLVQTFSGPHGPASSGRPTATTTPGSLVPQGL